MRGRKGKYYDKLLSKLFIMDFFLKSLFLTVETGGNVLGLTSDKDNNR